MSQSVGGSPGQANRQPHSLDYFLWNRNYFSSSQLENLAISGPWADASGDGVDNLLCYALGLDPTLQNRGEFFEMTMEDAVVFISFNRLERVSDLQLSVEVSEDLSDWSRKASLVSSLSNGDGTERVVFESPIRVAPEVSQFVRIQVTR